MSAPSVGLGNILNPVVVRSSVNSGLAPDVTVIGKVLRHVVVGMVQVMMALPADTPATTPVAEPTVAIEVAELVHLAPVIELVRPTVLPTATAEAPVTAGVGITVTVDAL